MTPTELDALIARGERFVLKDGSETGHCCFQFSIIDVTKPNLPVCECFNREDADAILSALRQGQQDARDAARYRWIRDCWYIAGEEWPEELQHEPTRPAQFDAAIDAAIAAEREGKS